jgi:hypothetical protein
MAERRNPRFLLCVANRGCEDLERRKVYRQLPDEAAAHDGYVRVVDESGEDFLYPGSLFVPVELPREVARVFSTRGQRQRAGAARTPRR